MLIFQCLAGTQLQQTTNFSASTHPVSLLVAQGTYWTHVDCKNWKCSHQEIVDKYKKLFFWVPDAKLQNPNSLVSCSRTHPNSPNLSFPLIVVYYVVYRNCYKLISEWALLIDICKWEKKKKRCKLSANHSTKVLSLLSENGLYLCLWNSLGVLV